MGSKMFKSKDKDGPLTAVIIGAGNRGYSYARYAEIFPDQFQVVGVAEPRTFYRERLQKQYSIPKNNVFTDWSDLMAEERIADCVIIGTPDRLHKAPAIAASKKGYHILLEKPMAVSAEDCIEIVENCEENKVILAVCHVLRYTPWAQKIKEIIESGAIGDVVNIQHLEPVGFWHFAHSYVRGNWHKESASSNSLLAKCCHDFDLIGYWMGVRSCTSISSFGHLSHFNKENKPRGAANRCMDCLVEIESKCPYSAKRIYLDQVKSGNTGWPVNVIAEEPNIESVTDAITTGPYGVCVYDTDNDVMSNQVVNMQFEGGATASLTMMAFTKSLCERHVKVFGTKGELQCVADYDPIIKHFDFVTEQTYSIPARCSPESAAMRGHGGADFHCMKSFVTAVRGEDSAHVISGPRETLNSHLLVFAAEKARKENKVVTMPKDGKF